MNFVRRWVDCISQAWLRFWFSPVSLLNIAVTRILLTGTLFLLYLSRHFDLKTYYSAEALLPAQMAKDIIPPFYQPPFLWYIWPDSLAPLMHGLLVLSLLGVALGIGGRWLCLLAWVLDIAFLQRNFSIAFGADIIGAIYLLYLSFTDSTARLSIRSFWSKSVSPEVKTSDLLTSAFYRMIQVQAGIIYLYTGMEKLKGATWWDGTALWSVFANPQMVIADLTFMKHLPLVIVFITFSTILFELYFIPMVWNERLRKFTLGFGVAFHVGIGLVMALWSFSLVMIAPYSLFLKEEETEKILEKIKSLFGKRTART